VQRNAPEVCHEVQEWVEGEETECPVLYLKQFAPVFIAYNEIEEYGLPHSGGWAEQPAKLMQYVKLIRVVMRNKEL